MTHPDTQAKNAEDPSEINFVKLVAWTCTVPIPSAGTFNVEESPFSILAHVVQIVREAA